VVPGLDGSGGDAELGGEFGEGTLPELDGQVHHDTHALPMGNYVIEVGKSLIRSPSQVGITRSSARGYGPSSGTP
jgi:hypothetical protein